MTEFGDAIADRDLLNELQNQIRKQNALSMSSGYLAIKINIQKRSNVISCKPKLQMWPSCKRGCAIPICGTTPEILQGEKWGAIWNNQKLNSSINHILHELNSWVGSEKYVKKHFYWTIKKFNDVNWDGIKAAKMKLLTTESAFITKQMYKKVPVQTQLHFFDNKMTVICPVYNDKEETWSHLLKCPGKQCKLHRFKCWTETMKTLSATGSSRVALDAIDNNV